MSHFGEYLRACRDELGLTQEQLARKIGVSQATISQYEQGEITPRPRNLVVLATALNRSPDELLAASGYLSSRVPEEREPSLAPGMVRRHQARPELTEFAEPIQRAAHALFATLQEWIAPEHWLKVVFALQLLVAAEGPTRAERTPAETTPQRGPQNPPRASAGPRAQAVGQGPDAEIVATYASPSELEQQLRVRLGIGEPFGLGSRGLDDATDVRSD